MTHALDVWHRYVSEVVRRHVGASCKVIEQPGGSREAGVRTFELAAMAGPPLDRIDRDRGGRVSVVNLFDRVPLDVPTLWFSWFERWAWAPRAPRASDFSITFYWGLAGRPRKQLLRAEWAAPERSPDSAAQPHWQVDTELSALTYVHEGPLVPLEPSEGLVEVPSAADAAGLASFSLSRLHLGMAGWANTPDYPGSWCADLGEDIGARKLWISQLLQHTRDQFRLLDVEVVTLD